MSKVLKIRCGPWENEPRDKRELSTYRELGANIVVMAKGEKGDKFKKECLDGFDVYKFSTQFLSTKFPRKLNNIISGFVWSKYARSFKPDIISCHDIYALFIGWLSTLFIPEKNKPKLIYDSHEFEIGRSNNRGRFQTICITILEGFLIRRCVYSIMVCDSIANEVQHIHNLKERPIVVRSTPEYWKTDPLICKSSRAKMEEFFGDQVSFLLMFHGNISSGKGINLLFSVLEKEKDIALVLMGKKTDSNEVKLLEKLAKEKSLEGRILYIPPVPQKDIWMYSGAVDVEMLLIQPIVKNHYYTLPNKFFEAVQSGTPVIASDLPELKAHIDKYQIGLTCNVSDMDSIINAVNRMRTDKDFYNSCKSNMEKAKRDLCWENEKKILIEAFSKINI